MARFYEVVYENVDGDIRYVRVQRNTRRAAERFGRYGLRRQLEAEGLTYDTNAWGVLPHLTRYTGQGAGS